MIKKLEKVTLTLDGPISDSEFENFIEENGMKNIKLIISEKYDAKLPNDLVKTGFVSHLKIDKKMKRISSYDFSCCELEQVELPEGLLEIGFDAFVGNNLTSIKIPNSVISIEMGAFGDNQLTNIELPPKLTEIYIDSFNDNNLKRITFYSGLKTIKKIYLDNGFKNIEEITIIDADYNYLKHFEENMLKEFPSVKKINLVNFIMNMDGDLKRLKLFDLNVDINVQNVNLNITMPKDAMDLVDEIGKIIIQLPHKKMLTVISSLNEILSKYSKEISKNKPNFNLNQTPNISLELENNSIENLQLQLIISLQTLLYNISSQNHLIEDLQTIKKYRNFLDGLEISDNDTCNKIQKILEISKKLNINGHYNYLINLFNKTEQDISSLIDFNLSIMLINRNYMQELENKINELYESYNKIYINTKPYFQIKEYITNDTFIDLKDLKIILNNLDKENKNKYTAVLEKLKNEFIVKIEEYIENIKNGNEVKSTKEIEIEFRNKLNPILAELKQDASEYEINGKLINELKKCLNLLTDENIEKIEGTVYETVIKINNLARKLEIREFVQVKSQVKTIISKWLEIVQENKYEELVKKYKEERPDLEISNSILIVQLMILDELLNLENYISSYIEDKKEYDSLKK